MGILFSLFFILIFIALIIVLFVLNFVRSIFSFGKRKNANQSENKENAYSNQKQRAKIFDKNEGEYAEFEEIK